MPDNTSELIFAGPGDNTVDALGGNDTVFGEDGNDDLTGGTGNDSLYGGTGRDTLFGGIGNDTLSGGTFVDTLYGGAGNDVFVMADNELGDHVYGGTETDTLDLSALVTGITAVEVNLFGGTIRFLPDFGPDWNYQIAEVENLIGTGGNDSLTGNAEANRIEANGGDDTIFGGFGNDRLYGGDGNDEMNGGDSDDTLYGGAGNDFISIYGGGIGDAVFGGAGANDRVVFDQTVFGIRADLLAGTYGELTGPDPIPVNSLVGVEHVQGGQQDDDLLGTAGVNSLTGGNGNDTLSGREGHDILSGDAGNDLIFGGEGNDTLYGWTENDSLYGDAGTDSLYGDLGNDRLDGGAGNDRLDGGLGNDRYLVDAAGDVVVGEVGFSLGGGIDTVESYVSFTLPANVEILRLMGGADISGTGSSAPDNIVGNTGANTLTGGFGNDLLNGKAGADRIIGGSGSDTMIGEAGNDTFVYLAATESGVGQGVRDFINGFVQGQDRIDLQAIDANSLTGANDAFTFIGTTAFGGLGAASAGQLRYLTFGTVSIVEADRDGNGAADMQIFVNLTTTLAAADFVL